MQISDSLPSITQEAAEVVLVAAKKEATTLHLQVSIAIIDAAGHLKAFTRSDKAPLISIQIAQDKAYTAVATALPTHQWYEIAKEDRIFAISAPNVNRFIMLGGGYPLTINGVIIGGIGVGGGHYTEDMKIAEAAIYTLQNITQIR